MLQLMGGCQECGLREHWWGSMCTAGQSLAGSLDWKAAAHRCFAASTEFWKQHCFHLAMLLSMS